MLIAKVVGNVVATKKEEKLAGKKLLLISPLKDNKYSWTNLKVAVDRVGAGVGDVVLLLEGTPASGLLDGAVSFSPVDMCIVGIIDEIQMARESLPGMEDVR